MLRNISKGLCIKTTLVVAPTFWFVAYQHMLSNDIPLRLALSFSILGIVTILVFGLGLEGLCSLLSGRAHTPRLDDRMKRAILQAAARGGADIGERLILCRQAEGAGAKRETIADDSLQMLQY